MKIATLSIPGTDGIDSNLPPGVPTGGLEGTGKNTIETFITIIVIMAILFSLWLILTGGISIIMSKGDKEKLKRARSKVTYAVVGLVLIFFVFVGMNILGSFMGFTLVPFLFNW